jgi:hypothetical protein
MLITTVLRNLKENGSIMRTNIFSLFAHGPLELAIADLAMVASTGFVLPLQQMYAKRRIKMGDKVITWNKEGHWIQHALQAVWLAVWVYLPFFFNWQWTRQVFFTLHALTLLMKVCRCCAAGGGGGGDADEAKPNGTRWDASLVNNCGTQEADFIYHRSTPTPSTRATYQNATKNSNPSISSPPRKKPPNNPSYEKP